MEYRVIELGKLHLKTRTNSSMPWMSSSSHLNWNTRKMVSNPLVQYSTCGQINVGPETLCCTQVSSMLDPVRMG